MQGIFQKENTDKALKYGIYRHLPTYEKIIRNLVSFYIKIKISNGNFQFIFYNTVVYGIRCIGTYSSAKFEYIKIYNIYESI